jgi:hypothetical protein
MAGPPFALFDFDFAQFLVNCLAVGGGFLAGFVLAGVLTWWIDRTFLRKNTPEIMHRTARVLGGLAVAILVALLVFGRGGGGLGGGKGDGLGSGTANNGTGTGTDAPDTTPKPGPTPPVAAKDAPPPGDRVRVTILGGPDVKEQRFYLVGDDPTPRTLAEAKAAIQAKKDTATRPVAVEVRFTARNTLARDHPAVTLLTNWARDAGIAVVLPAEPS